VIRCPEDREWVALVDGEVTRNRQSELEAHRVSCERCQGALARARSLQDLLAMPVDLPGDSEARAARVLSAIDQEAAAPPRRRARASWVAFGFAAAAAGILVLGTMRMAQVGAVQARGSALTFGQRVGVRLYGPLARRHELVDGARVLRSTLLTGSWVNRNDATLYLLLFGIDRDGEIHWLYPGYTDASKDPPSVPLPSAGQETAFDESVELTDAPAGEMRIVTVLSNTPLRVSDIERTPRGERSLAALRKRLRETQIDQTFITLQ
jgi:hypothetical protein